MISTEERLRLSMMAHARSIYCIHDTQETVNIYNESSRFFLFISICLSVILSSGYYVHVHEGLYLMTFVINIAFFSLGTLLWHLFRGYKSDLEESYICYFRHVRKYMPEGSLTIDEVKEL